MTVSSCTFIASTGVSGVVAVASFVATAFPLVEEARLGVTVESDGDCWEASSIGGGVLVADFLAGGVLFAGGGDLGLSAFRVLIIESNVERLCKQDLGMD